MSTTTPFHAELLEYDYDAKQNDSVNCGLVLERMAKYNQIEGPRVGDYLKLPYGLYTRFTYDWGEQIQTGNGSYYLGSGYVSHSGGLDPGVKKSDVKLSSEVKKGRIWFFSCNDSRAHNGVHFSIPFRVFELVEGADLSGLPQIKAYEKEQIRKKAETITRINGNGQPYTQPLPEIHISERELNRLFLKNIFDNTGLNFVKGAWGYTCQPMKHEQITGLLCAHKFKATFYNNATHHNTLMLELI